MDYELLVDELSESRRAIGVKIKRPVFNQRVEKAAKALSHRAEIKGFRKGKAPVAMIQKMYGDRLKLDVVDGFWREASQELFKDSKLKIFGFSKMDFEDADPESDVAIKVEATLLPEPQLKKLKGLEVSYESEKFTDKLVDDALLESQKRGAKTSPVVGREKAEQGDLVNISYHATIEGEEFPGSHEDNSYVEIGSGRSVEDLEKGLIGKKVGEHCHIDVKFPKDYPEESVREKTAHYHVDIKGLERADVPELTDEYVKENLGAESISELKERFEKRIKQRLDERTDAAKKSSLFKAIYEANPFEIGDLIIEEQMRSQLMRFGVINPREPNSSNMDISRFKPLLGEQAKQEVIEGFLASALVIHFKVEPSKDDIDNWLKVQAERYETEEDEIKKEFDFEKDPKRLTDTIARELAVEKVLADSKLVESPKA